MSRWLILVLAVTVVFVISCNRANTDADRQAIEALVEQDTVWFSASTTVDSTGTGGFDSDTVVKWWRGIQTHDEPNLTVEVVGDSAWVAWSRHNYGDFYVLAKPPDTNWVLWTKKVFETVQLRGVFSREGSANDDNRGWQLKQISLAYGQSDSAQTVGLRFST